VGRGGDVMVGTSVAVAGVDGGSGVGDDAIVGTSVTSGCEQAAVSNDRQSRIGMRPGWATKASLRDKSRRTLRQWVQV